MNMKELEKPTFKIKDNIQGLSFTVSTRMPYIRFCGIFLVATNKSLAFCVWQDVKQKEFEIFEQPLKYLCVNKSLKFSEPRNHFKHPLNIS